MTTRILFLSATLLVSALAFADVPLPPPAGETVRGQEAYDLSKALNGEKMFGSSSGWNGQSSSYNVFRSSNGLLQIVCEDFSNYKTHEDLIEKSTCTISVSKNGRPLPIFQPTRRLG
jgi:hypothetical protein